MQTIKSFIVLIAALITYSAIAVPVPPATLKKSINLLDVDATTGCTLLSNFGGLSKTLDATEKARACITCADTWAKDSKARAVTCGTTGDISGKQKEMLSKALADAVSSPDKNCDALGQLDKGFDLFTKEQRIQATTTCLSKWSGRYPKAQKAAFKPEDIDESKRVIGELPTWQEVEQAQTFARDDKDGEVKAEVTKEQFESVTKKR